MLKCTYYYQFRFYDPLVARFIQPDTIVPDPTDPQSLNRYSYVRNNPATRNDPSGRCDDDSFYCLLFNLEVQAGRPWNASSAGGSIRPAGYDVYTGPVGQIITDANGAAWHVKDPTFRRGDPGVVEDGSGNLVWSFSQLPGYPFDQYDYDYRVGDGSPQAYFALLQRECATAFPISGCQSGFEVGTRFALESGPFDFPVQVVDIQEAAFTLVALEGHPEGAGRTITFALTTQQDGTHLEVSTAGDGSLLTQLPLIRDVNFWIAQRTWSGLADNLRDAYGNQP